MSSPNPKKDIWSHFVEDEIFRREKLANLPPRLQAILDNCQYVIRSEFDKSYSPGSIKKPDKTLLSNQYREAFKTLSKTQKIQYYNRHVQAINRHISQQFAEPPQLGSGIFTCEVYSRSFSLGLWKSKTMRIHRDKHIIYVEKDQKIKTYVLEDYIMRKSKNKDYYSFVLEAINLHPHEKSRTVHLGFRTEQKFRQCYEQLMAIFWRVQWDLICSQFEGGLMFRGSHLTKSLSLSYSQNKKMNEKDQKFHSEDQGPGKVQIKSQLFFSYPVNEEDEILSKSLIEDAEERSQVIYREQPKAMDRAHLSLITVNNDDYFGEERHPEQIDDFDEKPKKFKKKMVQKEGEGDAPLLKRQHNLQQTVIESIAKFDPELIDELTAREISDMDFGQNCKKQNIFGRLMPEYDLASIDSTVSYCTLISEGGLHIYQHQQKPNKLKIFLNLPADCQNVEVLGMLIDEKLLKMSNPQVEELNLKTLIKSENSAMMYMKLKAYNRLYRPRDFVFLRHVFKTSDNTLLMVDKSIDNINYPPFTTIVRGDLLIVWAVKSVEENTVLVGDLFIDNQGYLNEAQNMNLILKFLKPFSMLPPTLLSNRDSLQYFNVFSQNWEIEDDRSKKRRPHLKSRLTLNRKNTLFRRKKISEGDESSSDNDQFKRPHNLSVEQPPKQEFQEAEEPLDFKSEKFNIKNEEKLRVAVEESEMEGQMTHKQADEMQRLKQQLLAIQQIHRDFDEEGRVIISNSFAKNRYFLEPIPDEGQVKYLQAIDGHPIWKGEWIRDKKEGSIIFINQKKINDQKGVLSFIIGQIGKNIFSGKSVMNISLPVDIFSAQSNLQLLSKSLVYSPTFLQTLIKVQNSFERLKNIVAFGISNSPLYLSMEKPFNPILGQTFQAWINGCPMYAEQISHHPPIAAIILEGRGFRLTAQLQSKIELHMNSGCGINDGIFRIRFEDGKQFCYTTPGGQVSGLTFGDRRFNMVGKSYYWIEEECLFVELVFNPADKGFFSIGKKDQPIDYFEGFGYEVRPQFFQQFLKKKRGPSEKQIVKKYGKFHGIWNLYVKYEEETIFDLETQFPAKLQYEPHPLPSDANWREDIAYRRILDISRAQTEKERLQVLQRNDRKLRAKFAKKK